ncbi:MAG: HEAT repeat domain-containing protein [Synechococcus sp.]
MTQAYVGGAAAVVLAAVLYAVGRRPSKPFLRNPDVTSVAALNRAQMELVQAAADDAQPTPAPDGQEASTDWQAPTSPAQVRALLNQLRAAMNGGPDQRLQAVLLAGCWGHRALLPLLRRGLRDADSRVVVAAASALDGRRGATTPASVQVVRPPRNVARMR